MLRFFLSPLLLGGERTKGGGKEKSNSKTVITREIRGDGWEKMQYEKFI